MYIDNNLFIRENPVYITHYKFNIHGKDDRPQVIRQWRLLGLPVINANPCDEEF